MRLPNARGAQPPHGVLTPPKNGFVHELWLDLLRTCTIADSSKGMRSRLELSIRLQFFNLQV